MSDFLGLLKDDAYAASFQTLGQYRTALIAAYRSVLSEHAAREADARMIQESNGSAA